MLNFLGFFILRDMVDHHELSFKDQMKDDDACRIITKIFEKCIQPILFEESLTWPLYVVEMFTLSFQYTKYFSQIWLVCALIADLYALYLICYMIKIYRKKEGKADEFTIVKELKENIKQFVDK